MKDAEVRIFYAKRNEFLWFKKFTKAARTIRVVVTLHAHKIMKYLYRNINRVNPTKLKRFTLLTKRIIHVKGKKNPLINNDAVRSV